MKTHKTKLSHFKQFIASLAAASLALIGTAKAEEYTLHFIDPVGEASTVLDITGMDFSFNPSTGDYRARIFSSDTIPFPTSGNLFRIHLNLLNLNRQEAGAGFELFSLIQDRHTTQYTPAYIDLLGANPILTLWQTGDRIAPGQGAATIGGLIPPLVSIRNTALLWGDAIALPSQIDDMGIDQFAIVQVPEPSSLALGGVGLAAFLAYRRLRTSFRPQ